MTKVNLSGANPYIPPADGDPPVKIGSMQFSMVEPNKGFEVAFNDWYERDHQLAGGTVGAGWFACRRWVATRRLKDLRFPADGAFEVPELGSLLSLFWREDREPGSAERWAIEQWGWLNAEHRIFSQRQHVHSASYISLGAVTWPEERVPLELALHHPYDGLIVTMIDDSAGSRADEVAKTHEIARETLISRELPSFSSWELARNPGQPLARPPGTIVRGELDTILQLGFVRGDPANIWKHFQSYAAAIERDTQSRCVFAAAFLPTVPGTTTYMDEL